MTIVLSILAFLSAVYFVILQILSPSTFMATILGFSMIWILISCFFVFLIFARKYHLWSKFPPFLKNFIPSFFGLVSILCVINLLYIIHPKTVGNETEVKYVILLGGGVTKDKKLSENVQNRCKKTADYLQKNTDAVAVVSGGLGLFAPCPESDVLKEYLVNLGISEERILCESQARDTIQNLEFSAQILADYENTNIQQILESPVLIVSSFNHLTRAQLIAKRLG